MHEIVTGRPDWKAHLEVPAVIDQAEAAYASDRKLARNLRETGWTPERKTAAWQGRAIMVDPDTLPEPTLGLNAVMGIPTPQEPPSVEFTRMRHQWRQHEQQLLASAYPEVRSAAEARQRELVQAIRSGPFETAGQHLEELNQLRETVWTCALAAGRSVDVRGEPVGLLELHELVLADGGILGPLPPRQPRILIETISSGRQPAKQVHRPWTDPRTAPQVG